VKSLDIWCWLNMRILYILKWEGIIWHQCQIKCFTPNLDRTICFNLKINNYSLMSSLDIILRFDFHTLSLSLSLSLLIATRSRFRSLSISMVTKSGETKLRMDKYKNWIDGVIKRCYCCSRIFSFYWFWSLDTMAMDDIYLQWMIKIETFLCMSTLNFKQILKIHNFHIQPVELLCINNFQFYSLIF
jgi:hypothetical protein